MAGRRAGAAVGALLAFGVLTAVVAVSAGGPEPVPAGLDGDGGTIAWTVRTAPGISDAHLVGDTVVALDRERLIGLDSADGSPRWSLPYPDYDTTFTVAGGMVAVQGGVDGHVDVVDPDTGRVVWSEPRTVRMIARDDALYLDSCPDRARPVGDCAVTKRRIADGGTAWTIKAPDLSLQDDVIGGRRPLAPPASAFLPVTTSAGKKRQGALLDTATGELLPGRADHHGWYVLAAGGTLVTTDQDPPGGAGDCPVVIDAVDARAGRPAWKGEVHSGRGRDDECRRRLSGAFTGTVMFGSGSTVAAVDRNGHTTFVDLSTGTVRWRAAEPGVPVAGDDRTLLVRDNGESGRVRLLDLTDGRRLWTAPDPGLSGSPAGRDAVVAGDLVAVMGATGDRPYVLVRDARTGRLLARRGGRLTGIGDGWVTVMTSAGPGDPHLHLLTF